MTILLLVIFILIVIIPSSLLWNIWKNICDEESKYLDELEKETR